MADGRPTKVPYSGMMVQKRERRPLDLRTDADLVTRKIGIGIFGFVFGLFISVVLLSLIGDWLIGRGLELIGAGLFAWFFMNKTRAASIQSRHFKKRSNSISNFILGPPRGCGIERVDVK